jgi:protein arginine kinase activator
MIVNKCHVCNLIKETPIHVTERNDDGTVSTYDLCQQCWEARMKELEGQPKATGAKQMVDLTHIKTPEELLLFLSGLRPPRQSSIQPCECGLTEVEFEDTGRFGCPKCYDHFKHQMEHVVLPFHKADQHVGKRPKRYIEHLMENPVEKRKILKLRLAKAVELEDYETAAAIKKELLNLESRPSEVSDQ